MASETLASHTKTPEAVDVEPKPFGIDLNTPMPMMSEYQAAFAWHVNHAKLATKAVEKTTAPSIVLEDLESVNMDSVVAADDAASDGASYNSNDIPDEAAAMTHTNMPIRSGSPVRSIGFEDEVASADPSVTYTLSHHQLWIVR